jgi:hypothetical protein
MGDGVSAAVRARGVVTILGTALAIFAVAGCSGLGGTPEPSATSPTATTPVAVTECGALEDAVTAVTSAHPDGVGLAVGSVPDAEQTQALQDLIDGLGEVDLTTDDLVDLRQAIVVASQTLVDRATSQEPIAQTDSDTWAGTLAAASTYCATVLGRPVPTPYLPPPATTPPATTPPGSTPPVTTPPGPT